MKIFVEYDGNCWSLAKELVAFLPIYWWGENVKSITIELIKGMYYNIAIETDSDTYNLNYYSFESYATIVQSIINYIENFTLRD